MRLGSLQPRIASLDTRVAVPPRPPKETLPFYKSPKWRRFIAGLIRARGRRCEEEGCNAKNVRIFGDHIIELEDGGAPFDPDNILLRCGKCHNKKTAREKAKRFNGRELSHPIGLRPATMPLTLVCGPPASGKTTYVRGRQSRTDLVIDLDVIRGRLTGLGEHSWNSQYLGAALTERNKLLARLGDTPPPWPRAWFIVGEPLPQWRAWWQEQLRPAEIVVLETADGLCLERIAAAPGRAKTRAEQSEAVMKWWNLYRRRDGETVIVS